MHHLPSRSPGLPPHSACRFTSDPHPNAEVARCLALRNGLLPAHSHRQLRSTWTAPPGSADDSRRPVALLSRHRFAGAQNPPTRTPASRAQAAPLHGHAHQRRSTYIRSPARERTRLQRVDALLPGVRPQARAQPARRPRLQRRDRNGDSRRVRCPARRGRYRRVAIANENRLVVPDTLGTTIKTTSLATC